MTKTSLMIGAALMATAAASAQPPGGHDPMAMLDADGNGQVSLAEIRRHAAQAFREIDSNGDGRATPDEFRAHHGKMMAAHGGHRGPPPGVERRGPPPGEGGPGGPGGPPHVRMDADGDGAVSLAEFTAGIEAHFAKADANGDGNVTREEMQAAHRGMHGRP